MHRLCGASSLAKITSARRPIRLPSAPKNLATLFPAKDLNRGTRRILGPCLKSRSGDSASRSVHYRLDSSYQHFQKDGPSFWQRHTRPARLVVYALFLGSGTYWYVSHLEVLEETGRKRLIGISNKDELLLGQQAFAQIVAQHQHDLVSPMNPMFVKVRRVAERLIKASKHPELEWQVAVIDSDQINAMCLPGGKVVVFTGIIKLLRSDNALAVVLSHEIAHAIARHGAEKLSFMQLLMWGSFLLNMVFDFGLITRMMLVLGFQLPFDRKRETEADMIGLDLMVKACYDPTEAPVVFAKISKYTPKVNEYLSTHPSDEQRIQNFNQWMPAALDKYKSQCHTPNSRFWF